MSELKAFEVTEKALFGRFYTKKVYDKDEADKVIAEKDAEIAELNKKLMPCLNGDCILTCEVVEKYGKENAELKAKLEEKDKEIARLRRAYLQAELERWKLESHFGWRSWKLDPPKDNENDGFIFCGHQKYDHQPDEETEYFVDVGHLDMDGTLCMFNDWHEGQETFEIDYWFPLPRHPDEPKKETKEDE